MIWLAGVRKEGKKRPFVQQVNFKSSDSSLSREPKKHELILK